MTDMHQYCTFYVRGQYFGLDVLKVQEIISYQEITRVPRAPAMMRGLINLRGQIVTAIDLRLRLGLPERSRDHLPFNVVVTTDDGAVSLLVDEIGDVVDVPESAFENPPETLGDRSRDLILGAYKMSDRLLMILDIHKIVNPDDAEPPVVLRGVKRPGST